MGGEGLGLLHGILRFLSVCPARSLHGNPLTDTGLALLNPALTGHPSLVSLDLGDCLLGDEGIGLICSLLPPDGAKPGETSICPAVFHLSVSSAPAEHSYHG